MSLFSETVQLIHKNAQLIDNPSFEELRKLSKKENPKKTKYGSLIYLTKLKGRSVKSTEIIENEPTQEQIKLINEVAQYLKGKTLLKLDRKMGLTKPFYCRAYISEKYPHIGYLWAKMLFDSSPKQSPDFVSVQIPEWPETKILVDPKSGITFILGSDYTGELKKANLRLAMYQTKKSGGLGLHAGSKVLKALNSEGNLIEKGVLIFGLSATGKTTLTCHSHWLDKEKGEGTIIRQDDVVLMQQDSHCLGTEDNFYIKTDSLEPADQPILWKAAKSKNTLLENVAVTTSGEVDFFDTSLTTNGRAVVLRSEMEDTDNSIDLAQTNTIIFLTRRNTIIPPVAKLNNEQAAAFFMLGESMGSAASDVSPGKPRRVVGTNPFIIGSESEEGNRFYKIISKNPHLDCYFLNTGSLGAGGNAKPEKITVHDSATIIKEIARGNVKWKKDPDWGYEILDELPGVDVPKFHPENFYSKERYSKLTKELKKERKEWLAKFPKLNPKISGAI